MPQCPHLQNKRIKLNDLKVISNWKKKIYLDKQSTSLECSSKKRKWGSQVNKIYVW